MDQLQERDLYTTIQQWRKVPPKTAELSEGTCMAMLEEIEQRRSKEPQQWLDQAEAVVLTSLSLLRMNKAGGYRMTREWLERAVQLDPEYRVAHELLLRQEILRLREEQALNENFPTIRETDNVVTRRRNVEILTRLAGEAKQFTAQQLANITHIQELARKLADEQTIQWAADLNQLFIDREELVEKLQLQVDAYAASLSGVFFSTELLGQLQETIRSIQEQRNRLEQIWQDLELRQETEENPAKTDSSALEELEGLIGLDEIKERVRQLAQFLQYRQKREEKGWHMQDDLPLHLVLMGNPGTGKTTLARLIARLYKELGLLASGQLIEVDRSHLVGGYVGQTEQRVMDAVKRADGGVLFIDEAYSLKRADSSGSDYGQAAIDTLVAAMTGGEYAGRFVVMLAGYPEEMRNFLYANPGLYSRFPETGHFLLPDYTTDELVQIASQVAERNDYLLTEEASRSLRHRIEKSRVDESFGNARTAANLILDAIFAKGRATAGKDLQWSDFTVLYPEDIQSDTQKEEAATASERLQALIGLEQVKAELKKITAFVRVQKERAERGMKASPVELHAVFTGNPGTGKTTVAALYAQILQEIGYLKRGHLVVASRADLVAGYVGQTAALTKRKIREALGGVLFIDEAYALFGTSEQDYGQEVVQTLVEEMTRHGENLVVVLAGYSEEMNRLLLSNPGLVSRFKKYIHFPDYTVDQLVQIIEWEGKNAGYLITNETIEKLAVRLSEIAGEHGIGGNGRFARNLVQEAMQNQAIRLTEIPQEEWNPRQLAELTWADFQRCLD